MKKTAKKKAPAKKAASMKKTARPAAKKTSRGFAMESMAAGFTSNDAEKSVAWYRDVLGFEIAQRWESDGKFTGASMKHGGVTFNIGQDDWKMGRDRIKGQGVRMYVTTGPGIDAYAAQVKARGGVLTQELSDGWGFRLFAIDDPDGFKITFMTPLKK
jgi:uncharacterized glyoxalase superfamily protein PhnB